MSSVVKHRPSDRCFELTTKHLVSILQSFELGASLVELWSLLDTPVSEQQPFMETAITIAYKEEQMQTEGSLSLATLQEVRLPTDFSIGHFILVKDELLPERPFGRFYLKPITIYPIITLDDRKFVWLEDSRLRVCSLANLDSPQPSKCSSPDGL